MDFARLAPHTDPHLAAMLQQAAAENGISNVFNPSVGFSGATTIVSFRGESVPHERPFRAFVLVSTPGSPIRLVDLTAHNSEASLAKAADPKLFTYGTDVYATFNTGNVHHGQNDIYIQQVYPEVGPLQRCVLATRRPVEKNWGFFEHPNGHLAAIYSLQPLELIHLVSGELGVNDELTFESSNPVTTAGRFPRVHIGSQPTMISPTSALIAANQQRPIPGLPRKIYFGRLASVDFTTDTVTLSRRGLIHSWRSMAPQRLRHNPGLLSATYFSGLSIVDESVVMSYGINDKDFGFARMPYDALWR